MLTIIGETQTIRMPFGVVDLDSFRRWTDTDDFPERGHIWWLKEEVWIDLSKEQIFSHVLVKTVITTVLGNLVQDRRLGLMLGSGLLLSNFAANISGSPDATFIATETLQSEKARLIEGSQGDYKELQGSPDMVLEVVSDSSVQKDTEVLRQAYWEADIREYWLVDARKERLQFDILRPTARSYVATRKEEGWMKSGVFGKSFRLRQGTDTLGYPDYSLDVR